MKLKPPTGFLPEGSHTASEPEAVVKAPFVKPHLTCHGAVVELTEQFGGSLTPSERDADDWDQ